MARRPEKKANEEKWTASDLILLDEIEDRLNGTPLSFGHIVVDEAQDLTAMGLRMIKRRAGRNSMTILGDLAQSTKPGGQTSWSSVLEHLDKNDADLVELEVGYRLPATILDYASQLLRSAAPGVRPSTSVREGGNEPNIVEVAESELISTAMTQVTELSERYKTVAMLVEEARLADAVASARDAGHDLEAEDAPVTVLEASVAKGLEFDAVVVLEPAAIVASTAPETQVGLRMLYVALTRAVQELTVVHAAPLPVELA